MNWPWVVAGVVLFVISAVYQRLYKRQDEYAAHLAGRIHRQQFIIMLARQLEESVRGAVPVMGQAMIQLSGSKALSLDIEEHYNALNFRLGEFREGMLGLRPKKKEFSDG